MDIEKEAIAALLHDAIEDQGFEKTASLIRQRLVKEVSRNRKLKKTFYQYHLGEKENKNILTIYDKLRQKSVE